MMNDITNRVNEAVRVFDEFAKTSLETIEKISLALIEVFNNKGSLYILGNGGSAADAQHVAAELVGKYYFIRSPLPAYALSTNTSILTALGNDLGIETIFERQIEAYVKPHDAVMLISTSGESENVLRAAQKTREIGAKVISLTGNSGGSLKPLSDICLCVPSNSVPRIQECHLFAEHLICELVEKNCK